MPAFYRNPDKPIELGKYDVFPDVTIEADIRNEGEEDDKATLFIDLGQSNLQLKENYYDTNVASNRVENDYTF